MHSNKFLAAVCLAVTLSACGKKQPGTYEIPDATAGSAGVDTSAADALWEQRADVANLQAALQKYEEIWQADPTNRDAAIRLTRGWYFMGDAYESESDAKIVAWETAVSWGKKCMALNGEFTALLENGNETEATAVRVATVDDGPCIYWSATALGKWAGLKGLGTLLKHKATVFAYISKVAELDSSYYYNATDRYWGAYYSALPSFAGQDLPKSKEHFDIAIAAAPQNLSARVLMADYYAVRMQDRALFEQLLNEVLAADATVEPALEPENLAEQEKARRLLENADELFAN